MPDYKLIAVYGLLVLVFIIGLILLRIYTKLLYYKNNLLKRMIASEEKIQQMASQRIGDFQSSIRVQNLKDGSVHEIWSYTKEGDKITVQCESWPGHHQVGKDCEFTLRRNS